MDIESKVMSVATGQCLSPREVCDSLPQETEQAVIRAMLRLLRNHRLRLTENGRLAAPQEEEA